MNKNRFLIPLPLFLANISASFFQLFPKPLLTLDQLKLLKYDNIASGKYQTNFDIGLPSISSFEEEVKKFYQVCPKEMLDKLENPISAKSSILKAI